MASPPVDREYHAIRTALGVTELKGMVKLRLSGDAASAVLEHVVAGNVGRLAEDTIRWTVILDERGCVVADVQIYREFDEFLVTCDTDAHETVLAAFRGAGAGAGPIEDRTSRLAAIAVEGPDAPAAVEAVAGPDARGLSLLRFTRLALNGAEVMLARIGFTGEFGYFFFVEPENSEKIIARILTAAPAAARCGAAVHDLLRLEMRAFNRTCDIFRNESALEAGLHWMIDFRKPGFRGRDAVFAEKSRGLRQRLLGFVLDGEAALDRGAAVSIDRHRVGYVTNAAWSPTLRKTIGLAYLDQTCAWVGVDVDIEHSAGVGRATTASAPFFVTESTRRAAR